MLLHFIAIAIFLYILFRFVLPLSINRATKIVIGVLLLIASQQHAISRYFFHSMAAPELPARLLIFQGWVFASLLFLFLLVVSRDLCLCLLWLKRRGKAGAKTVFSSDRRAAMFSMLAMVPAAYGVRQGVAVPEIHTTEACLASLPSELDGLCLVQLTDMHISRLLERSWVQAVVDRVNALEPDLIVFTGDVVDGLPPRRADSVMPLKALRARYGVFGCVGNHEYYSNYHAWAETFPKLGITMLYNSHAALSIKGKALVLAGVTDTAAERFGLPMPDAAKAVSGAPKQAVRILLAHRPVGAASHAKAGFDLQLSGHTHGGQLMGLNQVVAQFNGGYLSGWYSVDAMKMYVSPGTGLWGGFPLRFGVASEITRILLRKG